MNTAILHYSIPPIVGGVEAVIQAHTSLLIRAGYPVRLIAGTGEAGSLPAGAEFVQIPEMDSRNPSITQAIQELEAGKVPGDFEAITSNLEQSLMVVLQSMDNVMVHNVFTKHFNLPLTAALVRLLDGGKIRNCIAWCHDFTWTSPHSRSAVYPGYPWDLLRTYREDVTYVTVSQQRQVDLAGLYHCPLDRIHVVYAGVDPADLFSLSTEGSALIERLGLLEADLALLMPVRITQAKNIELALNVMAGLKANGLHSRLVVTGPPDPHDPGDMEYYQSLLDLRRKLGVEYEARFVYESSVDTGNGYTIALPIVRELFRVCDALFMPSHREGFGMPILEAGLIGMPVFSTEIPATQEIGGQEVIRFAHDASPGEVAGIILGWAKASAIQRLRQRVRQKYTWQAIFQHDIQPLLMEVK